MLILSIDTAGPSGGISLAEADAGSFRVVESAAIAGGTFSAQLIPTLAALLKKHGFRAADIGGFAAASGPGSFTGLRVGLSAVKGLAETLRKPIAVVTLLEAMAALSGQQGKIAAAMDAGRTEIFFGLYQSYDDAYQSSTHAPVRIREELLNRSAFHAALTSERPALLITSDASIAELGKVSQCRVEQVQRPGSEMIACIGAQKLLHGETVSVEALDATYLRRSDAEIFFKGQR